MKLTAIGKGIIFQFVDAINSKGEFDKSDTETGIMLKSSFDDSAKEPRWVKVTSAGKDCEYVKTGDVVLLPALRWTEGSKLGDQKYWKSDESEVVAIDRGETMDILGTFLTFTPDPDASVSVSESGMLLVVGGANECGSHTGTVHQIGNQAYPDLNGAKVYYLKAAFHESFKFNGSTVGFLKEDDVLCYEPNE